MDTHKPSMYSFFHVQSIDTHQLLSMHVGHKKRNNRNREVSFMFSSLSSPSFSLTSFFVPSSCDTRSVLCSLLLPSLSLPSFFLSLFFVLSCHMTISVLSSFLPSLSLPFFLLSHFVLYSFTCIHNKCSLILSSLFLLSHFALCSFIPLHTVRKVCVYSCMGRWRLPCFVITSKEKSGIEPFVAHVSESQRCYESICSFLAWDVFGIKREK